MATHLAVPVEAAGVLDIGRQMPILEKHPEVPTQVTETMRLIDQYASQPEPDMDRFFSDFMSRYSEMKTRPDLLKQILNQWTGISRDSSGRGSRAMSAKSGHQIDRLASSLGVATTNPVEPAFHKGSISDRREIHPTLEIRPILAKRMNLFKEFISHVLANRLGNPDAVEMLAIFGRLLPDTSVPGILDGLAERDAVIKQLDQIKKVNEQSYERIVGLFGNADKKRLEVQIRQSATSTPVAAVNDEHQTQLDNAVLKLDNNHFNEAGESLLTLLKQVPGYQAARAAMRRLLEKYYNKDDDAGVPIDPIMITEIDPDDHYQCMDCSYDMTEVSLSGWRDGQGKDSCPGCRCGLDKMVKSNIISIKEQYDQLTADWVQGLSEIS